MPSPDASPHPLTPLGTPEEDRLHAEASMWTQNGIALLASDDPLQVTEALRCFDAAIRSRESLPLDQQPWYRWGLTAAWMNRAEALSRLSRHDEALAACEAALAHLQKLPLDLEPAFRWRLGLAWMNHALTLSTLQPDQQAPVLASLDEALRVLNHPSMTSARDLGTLGCVWLNRAACLLSSDPSQAGAAQEAARKALDCLQLFETTDPAAAQAALLARHHFCQATAHLLESSPVDTVAADEWILTATDEAEAGLALVKRWPAHEEAFGDIPLQLFHFGCRMYLAFQPQFLGEFILDTLRPAPGGRARPEYCHAATECFQHAAEMLRQRGPADLGPRRLETLIGILAQLDEAAAQVRQWHPKTD